MNAKTETKERRSLLEGLRSTPPVERDLEEAFIYGSKPKETPASPPTPISDSTPREGKAATQPRVPLTTRVRADFALALKRASLERQLNGMEPNTLQEILEESLEPWLRANGYLT